ncbi:hypothetical protein [Enterobacter cloacae]|uniref:hypothetical protein n=1 Tax=Enterobacter cloacae TaxID=550 RepID=UPI001E646F4D|nr:hypothetical protein [Enterobacter cloacae]
MEIFFKSYQTEGCCLCGSSGSLTGEHKIKASALRKIFGSNAMVIGDFDDGGSLRTAQGPKSKAFHFSARMCSSCNGSRTQPADQEFDQFHTLVSSLISEGRDPSEVFNMPQYDLESEAYLNVFRYFSKILCCQIAEAGGPRPIEACEFAIGKTSRNMIFLHIDVDPIYLAYRDTYGRHSYARHGGLIVPFDSNTHSPTCFQSLLSLGAVRYRFWVRFNALVEAELRTSHHEFWLKCEAAYQEAIKNPLSDEQRYRLGI